MKRWLRQLFCMHRELTKPYTVSGYGYTEYRMWFCCRCEKCMVEQIREQQ